MSTSEIDELLRFGHQVVAEAGTIAARYFRHQIIIANKRGDDGFDPVTEADREVEARIRERIVERYPKHGVVGEEYGATSGSSAWSWIVDPIDGTRAFVMGLPVWGCLLGILRDGEPVGGLMHQPVVGETFSGDGAGAWVTRGGVRTRIQVRTQAELDEAVLVATHPSMFRGATLSRFEALAAQVRMMRYGGDCYNYCLLAHGLVDLVVEDDLQPYDILPLVPIVRGAGGIVTDLAGRTPRGGVMVIAAANERLHRQAMAEMGG